jgi:hypothetical protein
LGGLLIAFILLLTIATSFTIGIIAAYGVVNDILYAFAYQSRQQTRRIPRLVPSEAHAGGD